MKLLCFLGVIAACASYAQQQGTTQTRITTQTRSTPTVNATSVGTTGVTGVTGTGVTGTGTTGTTTTGTGTTTTGTGTTTTGTATAGGTTTLTGDATQTAGIVTATNAPTAQTPVLENTTNLFGQIVGVTANLPAAGVGSGTAGTLLSNGTGTTIGTVAQQRAQGIGAPGFTQVTITLQGTVQSEVDRQSILNRFQGLPGFVVVDQLQVAGKSGQSVNEAAGAGTSSTGTTGTGTTQP